METTFISSTLSFLVLLLISSFVYLLWRKIKINYTILLVLVWLLLVPISKIEFFSFINDFKLTPDVLFFIFLPVLLFEAAYNINYKDLLKNSKSIFSLAIWWLLISTIIIASWLYFILPLVWFNIPFIVCLLFWAIISATDPVAVIAIFKSVWAPKRLTLIFEWESLFNDWTAVALFMVILWIILEWINVIGTGTYFLWIWQFISMLFWWIIFWWIMWFIFSKILWKIRHSEEVEIVLTMISAHFTFILAEILFHHFEYFPISWVIATVIASIVIWNYGRYKITPRVEAHMQKFWEFFAFVANSIVFILIWLTLSHINIDFSKLAIPIFTTIIVVMFARAVSVYIPLWILNFFKLESHIPNSWKFLLSWWSLRWALALMMALKIPWPWDENYEKIMKFQEIIWWNFDFSIRDFILVLVISSIIFTLFIKAPIIEFLVKKLKLNKLSNLEKFEFNEAKILVNLKILSKLKNLYERKHILKEEYQELNNFYDEKLKQSIEWIKDLVWKEKHHAKELIKKAISIHALWMEKKYLQNLFLYNEIDEPNFKFILWRIKRQKIRLESGEVQFKKLANKDNKLDVFEKIVEWEKNRNKDIIDKYIRNRSKEIITRKVIKELQNLEKIDFWFDSNIFKDIIKIYEDFYNVAKTKKDEIIKKYRIIVLPIEAKLINKSFMRLEEETVEDLHKKEIITSNIFIKFKEEIENEIYNDVKRLSL